MRKLFFAGAVLGVAVSACTVPGDNESNARTADDLNTVLAVGPSLRSCSLDEVSSRLGVTFTEVNRREHTVFWVAEGSGMISRYDLRSPIPAGRGGGILVADVRPRSVLFEAAVEALGGPEPSTVSNDPDDPEFAWGYDIGRNLIWLSHLKAQDAYLNGVAVHCR